jgi:hypothetical protein
VEAFFNYTSSLSTFVNGLTDGILGAQSAVNQLTACKPPANSTTTSRLLQASSPTSPTGNSGGTQQPPSGNNTNQQPPSGNNTNQQPSKGNNTNQQPGNGNNTNQQSSNGNNTMPPQGNNQTSPNQGNNGNNNNNNPPPRDQNKNVDVPAAVSNSLNDTIQCVNSKTGNDWVILASMLNSFNTHISSIKTKPSLAKDVISHLKDSDTVDNEFKKIPKKEACNDDYIYYCTAETCVCSGTGCPSSISGSKTYSKLTANINTDSSTSLNELSNYFVSSICCNKIRSSFATANYTVTGTFYDFKDTKNGADLGKAAAAQNLDCIQALTGSDSTAKKNCRGNMNEACANNLDKTCANTGLTSTLANAPPSMNPNPKECDTESTDYSIDACFNWILDHLTKGSITFDYAGFNSLASAISSDSNTQSVAQLRYLTSTYTTTSNDPTSTDSKAQIDGSINNDDIAVDSSTPTKAASYDTYNKELSVEATNTPTSAGFFAAGKYLILFGLIVTLF